MGLFVLAAIITFTACDSGYTQKPPVSTESERIPCHVLKVFDGDTIACDLNGNAQIEKPREYIRFLGIDAPETRYSRRRRNNPDMEGRDEPFSVEARTFVQNKLLKKKVYLMFDQEKQDPFGRTLAFIYEQPDAPQSINEQLLEQGLVTTLFIHPNKRFQKRFERIETQARMAQQGLWQPN